MASSSASGTKADNNTQQEQGDDKIAQEVVLQKHAGFFDRNHDGLIYPWETYQGMRAIGSGIMLSLAAAIIVNITLSLKTRSGKFPNLLFPIEIKNIHRAKHGSDSDAFDSEGRFDPVKFEEIFTKHAHTYPNALTKKEMKELMKANREPKDFNGWLSAFGEWPILYSLAKDENGLLQKETVRAVYDGSLFERLEKEHLASKKKK